MNTHSSTFRPREAHHASLTTGTRGAWGSGATILTSRTLRTEGTEPEVKLESGWVGGGGALGGAILTGGPVLPSGPGLPGLPVRP